MAKEFHSGPEKGKPIYSQNSFPLRLLAILLMIAGAAGFVATLLVLDGQELFLFGSTVITFIGLGLILGARRFGWGNQVRDESAMRLKPRQMPMEELPGTSTLLDQVLAVSARDRAQVKVVARQESRGILQITARDGKTYSAIVNEDPGSEDVADSARFVCTDEQQPERGRVSDFSRAVHSPGLRLGKHPSYPPGSRG